MDFAAHPLHSFISGTQVRPSLDFPPIFDSLFGLSEWCKSGKAKSAYWCSTEMADFGLFRRTAAATTIRERSIPRRNPSDETSRRRQQMDLQALLRWWWRRPGHHYVRRYGRASRRGIWRGAALCAVLNDYPLVLATLVHINWFTMDFLLISSNLAGHQPVPLPGRQVSPAVVRSRDVVQVCFQRKRFNGNVSTEMFQRKCFNGNVWFPFQES